MTAESTYLIDIGNTRIKATPASQPFTVTAVVHSEIRQLLQTLTHAKTTRILLVVGRSAAAQHSLATLQAFAARQAITVTTVSVRTDWLSVNYQEVSQFGVDRFLHLLAAKRRYQQQFCVVSAGTAITLDFFSNKHLGGMILPGLGSAQSLLAEKTGLTSLEKPSTILGNSTATSIGSGLYFGFKNLIYSSVEQVEKEYKTLFRVVLTGGDAQVLYKHGIIINHLLFEGMLSYLE